MGTSEVSAPPFQKRRGGKLTSLLHCENFQVQLIEMFPGASTAEQCHLHRDEHLVVLEGEAEVRFDGEKLTLNQSDMLDIPAGFAHGLANIGTTALKVIEITIGDLRDDDCERIIPEIIKELIV